MKHVERQCRAAIFIIVFVVSLLPLNGNAANNRQTQVIPESQIPPQLLQQRADFIAARNALKQGQIHEYQRFADKLADYPLYPYLEYWSLNRQLVTVSAEQVNDFTKRYPDIPVNQRLRQNWLKKLAQEKKWQLFADNYQPGDSVEMQCYFRRALYNTGDKDAALDNLKALWLSGKSQPRACDPLFSVWQDSGHPDSALAWQRVMLAFDSNQVYLARYLERFLTPTQQQWSQTWREIHRHPERLVNHPQLKQDIPVVRTILAHGIQRLARNHADKAAQIWDSLIMTYAFSAEMLHETEQAVAIALARQDSPDAIRWLASINSENETVRKWRILTAINQQHWQDAITWIERLPDEERQSLRWRYWLARALEATGQKDHARSIYTELARSRDYYGFLAADKINTAYDFEDRPLAFNRTELAAIENLPGVIRAREFYQLGDLLSANREWYATLKTLNDIEAQKFALILHGWGWHDRAIHSLGNARYLDDLEIRFPLAHSRQIQLNAERQKVDPSWAYAVIRQESAFAPRARSPKGAMGLMQIMPSTGRLIARDLNTKLGNTVQLFDADTNIRFGISYLRKVMDRFDSNTVLATAAYNAGSERVKSWLPEADQMPADVWIENIPYKETRNYLKQVLAFTAIYDQRQQRPITPLQQRMPLINALER